MVRRPDTSAKAVEQTLLTLGYAQSMAGPFASDYRLIVPIVLKALGVEEIARIMSNVEGEKALTLSIQSQKASGLPD